MSNKCNLCTIKTCRQQFRETFRRFLELRQAYKVTAGTNLVKVCTICLMRLYYVNN